MFITPSAPQSSEIWRLPDSLSRPLQSECDAVVMSEMNVVIKTTASQWSYHAATAIKCCAR